MRLLCERGLYTTRAKTDNEVQVSIYITHLTLTYEDIRVFGTREVCVAGSRRRQHDKTLTLP